MPQAADGDPALAVVGEGLRVAALTATRGVELDRRRAGRRPDDRVVHRGRLAVVDARLRLGQLAGRRDVLGDPLRLAAGLPPVAVRRHQPVAVGVDGLEVVPVLGRDAVHVELADAHHDVGLGAVHGVAVHVEGLGEGVVAAHLLQLLVRRAHHAGVDQPDAGQRLGVGLQLAGGGRGLGRVAGDLHVVHAVGSAGGGDVALDVGALLHRLAGTDAEVLDGPGVDHAEHDGREHHQDERDGGHHPAAQDGVGEEQQPADQGDHGEDRLRRHGGVVGGVVEAGQQRLVLDLQPVAVEPVADAPHHDGQADQERQLRLGRGRGTAARAGEAQRAHHVVHDRRRGGGEAEQGEEEGQREAPPRVGEDEEGDVQAELGVRGAERGGVAPGQEGEDLAARGATGEEPDQHGDRGDDPDEAGLQQLPVALEQRAARRPGADPRPEAVGEGGAAGHGEGHQQAAAEEQADPDQQHLVEDGAEVERAVPEPVGPHAGEDGEQDHQHGGDHQGGQDGAPASTDAYATQKTRLSSGSCWSSTDAEGARRPYCSVQPPADATGFPPPRLASIQRMRQCLGETRHEVLGT